jgi:hypothetical protein
MTFDGVDSDRALADALASLCTSVHELDGWDEAKATEIRVMLKEASTRWAAEATRPSRLATSLLTDFFRAIWEQAPGYAEDERDALLANADELVEDVLRALGPV